MSTKFHLLDGWVMKTSLYSLEYREVCVQGALVPNYYMPFPLDTVVWPANHLNCFSLDLQTPDDDIIIILQYLVYYSLFYQIENLLLGDKTCGLRPCVLIHMCFLPTESGESRVDMLNSVFKRAQRGIDKANPRWCCVLVRLIDASVAIKLSLDVVCILLGVSEAAAAHPDAQLLGSKRQSTLLHLKLRSQQFKIFF